MGKKKLFLVINMILIMLFSGGCGRQTEQALPKLVIGYDDYRPYCYYDEDGEPAGIAMEIADVLAMSLSL